MKIFTLTVAAVALLALGASQAFANPSSSKVVTVAMHDPGCHWFLAGGKYVKTLTVKGPASLSNLDEATLVVAGPAGVKRDPVGKQILLGRGVYRITMVGQAPDDNRLRLVVR